MLLGYARVSTLEQNLDRQIDALVNAGVDPRMIYQEKITGTKLQRPELNRLLEDLQPGDVLIIPDLTRISRSTKDLLMLVDQIIERHLAGHHFRQSVQPVSSYRHERNQPAGTRSGSTENKRRIGKCKSQRAQRW